MLLCVIGLGALYVAEALRQLIGAEEAPAPVALAHVVLPMAPGRGLVDMAVGTAVRPRPEMLSR